MRNHAPFWILALAFTGAASQKALEISSSRPLWVSSDDSRMIQGEGKTWVMEWRGSVEARHDPYTLWADKLVGRQDTGEGVATGSVVLKNDADGITLQGGRLTYQDSFRDTEVEENPTLVKVNAGGRTVTAKSRRMQFSESERRGWLREDVEIVQGDLVARCGLAEYRVDEELLILTQSPVVNQGKNFISAESIVIHVPQERAEFLGRVEGELYGESSERAAP